MPYLFRGSQVRSLPDITVSPAVGHFCRLHPCFTSRHLSLPRTLPSHSPTVTSPPGAPDSPHSRTQARPSSWQPPNTRGGPARCWCAVVAVLCFRTPGSSRAPRDFLSPRPSSTSFTSRSHWLPIPSCPLSLPMSQAPPISHPHLPPHHTPPLSTTVASIPEPPPRPVPEPTELAIARPPPPVTLPTALYGDACWAPNW